MIALIRWIIVRRVENEMAYELGYKIGRIKNIFRRKRRR